MNNKMFVLFFKPFAVKWSSWIMLFGTAIESIAVVEFRFPISLRERLSSMCLNNTRIDVRLRENDNNKKKNLPMCYFT